MPNYPKLSDVEEHIKLVRTALRTAGVPDKAIASIQTRALRTGRKVTGIHATNRASRWTLVSTHPQYGTERDCKIIFVKLCAQLFCFDGAPKLKNSLSDLLGEDYLGHIIKPGIFRDRLLLERFSFSEFIKAALNPVHGHSFFHIGHEDPTQKPKHTPDNISWRSHRSNLIQGDMTLREARVYFIKLIGRYFELGELNIK
jgi:hypothetical protein